MKLIKLSVSLGIAAVLSACTATGPTSTTTVVGGASGAEANYNQAYQDYVQLGAEYVRRGRHDLAEPKLKRAIEIDSQRPEAWNILAVMYEETRNIAAGTQAYQKLIASHPNYTLGFVNYATFLCKFDREQEFQQLLGTMRSKGSEFSALSYIAEGDCRRSKNQASAAAGAYQQALNFDNHAEGALLPLAELAVEQGNHQGALNYLNIIHTYVGYSPESVRLGILAARGAGNAQMENDLLRIMRSSYQGTQQARSLGI